MNYRVSIVLGLGFGDEGKGSQVNYLCSQLKKPLVIRFNGGHQVGHTVVLGDKRHVFSNFGSGTLQDAPTYWSKYCTVSPIGVQKEGKVLNGYGIKPKLYFDAEAMVTTPFDILMNYKLEELNRHGSVGVGFGQTIGRNEDHYHLYVRDLLYPEIRDQKLKLIQEKYYRYPSPLNAKAQKLMDDFVVACDDLVMKYEICNGLNGLYDHNFIFEGGQGIMLDTDYGFFPNVTRSYTTSRNALEIIKTIPFNVGIHTYYMTRAYQCRHGNGYMTNQDMDVSYITENPKETNINSGFQGEFRKSVLDLNMLRYAISCDKYYNNGETSRNNMVVTCLDQVPEDIPVTLGGELTTMKYKQIASYCGITNEFGCWSDEGIQNS